MEAQLEFAVRSDIEQLIDQLASDHPVERERARKSLVQIGHDAVIPLIHELKSPSNRTCWEATKALGAIREMAAATDLAENLDHDDGGIRWATAEALIALGDEGLKQTLVTLLTKASSGDLRRAARHVIWHFGHFARRIPAAASGAIQRLYTGRGHPASGAEGPAMVDVWRPLGCYVNFIAFTSSAWLILSGDTVRYSIPSFFSADRGCRINRQAS